MSVINVTVSEVCVGFNLCKVYRGGFTVFPQHKVLVHLNPCTTITTQCPQNLFINISCALQILNITRYQAHALASFHFRFLYNNGFKSVSRLKIQRLSNVNYENIIRKTRIYPPSLYRQYNKSNTEKYQKLKSPEKPITRVLVHSPLLNVNPWACIIALPEHLPVPTTESNAN